MSKFFQALERAEQERALHRSPEEAAPVIVKPDGIAHSFPAPARRAERSTRPDLKLISKPSRGVPEGIEPHLVSLLAPTTFEAEQYKTLSFLLERLHKDSGLSTIAVSSPTVGDGKTTTAINLAGALAQLPDARVLLVDLDLRRPSMSMRIGLDTSDEQGLVGATLNPNLSLTDVVRPCPAFRLTILPAGRVPATPHEVLKSSRFSGFLTEMRQEYDYIVLDTPPLIPFPDCRILEQWVDGFLLVVAAHKTPRKLLEEATNAVDPTKLLGLVFNNDDRPMARYYSYYSYGDGRGVKKSWATRAVEKLKTFL